MMTKLIILTEIVNDTTNALCGDIDNKAVGDLCNLLNHCQTCPVHSHFNHDQLKNFNETINEHKSNQPD